MLGSISAFAQNPQTRAQGSDASAALPTIRFSPELPRPLAAIAGDRGGGGRVHVVLRSGRPLGTDQRRALDAAGIRLLDPLPGGARYASVAVGSEGAKHLEAGSLSLWGLNGVAYVDAADKLTETLRDGAVPGWARTEVRGALGAEVHISFFGDTDRAAILATLQKYGAIDIEISDYFERVTAKVPVDRLLLLANSDWVRFVDTIPAPARTFNNSESAALIRVNEAQGPPWNLTGEGVRIAIVDESRVANHVEFGDRLTVVDGSSTSRHSTHVAGTIAAAGEFDPRVKGMAPRSRIYTYSFAGDVAAKMLAARQLYGVEMVSNSWGEQISEAERNCSLFGAYGSPERDMDRLVRRERVSIVFAIGNSRDEPGCSVGPRAGFYTAGRPGSAKNVISVAAVDNRGALGYFSGYGPSRDGRLKPEISALGMMVRSTTLDNGSTTMSGTSMSTPAITGLLALMVERYRVLYENQSPDPALLKAVLLNTAEDLGNPGPDYSFGYGLANAAKAMTALDERRFMALRTAGEPVRQTIEVPPGAAAVRVMLTYLDPEGSASAGNTLIHDLNLKLAGPDGTEVLPLTLDPLNPSADAQPGRNTRDPVEQVLVRNPAAGTWTAEVTAESLSGGEQEFVLTWEFSDSPIPACTTSLNVPSGGLQLPKDGGSFALAVTRPNQCEPWSADSSEGWLTVRPAGNPQGSGALKINATANPGPGARRASVRVAGSAVPVSQEAPCPPNAITPGVAVSESLSSSDCRTAYDTYERRYAFHGSAGQRVAITLRSDVLDSYLELRTEAGQLIAEDDDGGGGLDSRIPPDAGLLTLPATGLYVIVVTTYEPNETGSFTLSLELQEVTADASLPKTVEGCPYSMESTLTQDSSRTGRRGDLFPTDLYLFEGRIGQQVIVEIPEAAFDSVLYLISPSGRLAAFNDDASGAASRIEAVHLTEEGRWQIEVAGFAPNQQGPYRISIQGCSPPPQ